MKLSLTFITNPTKREAKKTAKYLTEGNLIAWVNIKRYIYILFLALSKLLPSLMKNTCRK